MGWFGIVWGSLGWFGGNSMDPVLLWGPTKDTYQNSETETETEISNPDKNTSMCWIVFILGLYFDVWNE